MANQLRITVASVNVNGLRAATLTGKSARNGYGLREWLNGVNPKVDLLALQELKATKREVDEALAHLGVSNDNFYMQEDALKKGHAGVAIIVLNPALKVQNMRTPFEGQPETEKYLTSGRWIELDISVNGEESAHNSTTSNKPSISEFTLVSAYIHHADSPTAKRKASKAELDSGSKPDITIERKQSEFTMNNKHYFMQMMTSRIRELLESRREVIIAGDYNIAHHDIDIKNSAGNATKAGFLPEERAWLDLWLAKAEENALNSPNLKKALSTYQNNPKIAYKAPKMPANEFKIGGLGLRDVCREVLKDQEVYSWWTYMGRAFDNDAGWRIDYQFATDRLASAALKAHTVHIDKQPTYDKRYSDHAPVVVQYAL